MMTTFQIYRYGRRPVIRVSSVLFIIMGLGTAWLPDLIVLIVVRVFMGILHIILIIAPYILGKISLMS